MQPRMGSHVSWVQAALSLQLIGGPLPTHWPWGLQTSTGVQMLPSLQGEPILGW